MLKFMEKETKNQIALFWAIQGRNRGNAQKPPILTFVYQIASHAKKKKIINPLNHYIFFTSKSISL